MGGQVSTAADAKTAKSAAVSAVQAQSQANRTQPAPAQGSSEVTSAPAKPPVPTANLRSSNGAGLEGKNLIPTVFKWEHGGNEVYLSGTFNGWSHKIPMHRSGNDFSHIMSLPPGEHAYKFIVDNEWRFASDQRTVSDKQGNINNYIDLANFKPDEFLAKSQSVLGSWDAPPPLPPRRGRQRRRRVKRKSHNLPPSSRIQRDDGSSTSSPSTSAAQSSDSRSGDISDSASSLSDSDTELMPPVAAGSGQPGPSGERLTIRTRTGPSAGAASHRRRRRHMAIGLADRVPLYEAGGGYPSSSSEDEGHEYSTSVPSEDKYTKDPPGIAPHLRAMPLNHDFPATPTGHKLLPIPSHVGVGHLFCTAVKGDLTVHGVTTRYKRKFTTMVFYSPQTVRGADVVRVAREGGGLAGHVPPESAGAAPRKTSSGSISSSGAAGAAGTAGAQHAAAPPHPQSGGGGVQPPQLPHAATVQASGAADTHVVVQTTSGPLTVCLTAAHRQAIDNQRAMAQQRLSAHRESLRAEVAAGNLSRRDAEEMAQQAQAQAEEWLAMAQNQVLQAALVAQFAAEQSPAGAAVQGGGQK